MRRSNHDDRRWRRAKHALVSSALVALTLAALTLAAGCSGPNPAHPPADEAFRTLDARPVKAAVARVDGHPISLDEFQAFWNAHPKMTRDEALDALIDRQVLVDEAIKRGYLTRSHLQVTRKQAMVEQLLADDVEGPASKDDLSDKDIDDLVSKLRAQVGHPPGLRASHLLIMVPPAAQKKASKKQVAQWFSQAKDWLGTVRDDLPEAPTADDLLAAKARFKGKLPKPLSVQVNVHMVFPIEPGPQYGHDLPDGWHPVVPAFREAATEMAKKGEFGEMSDPVKTHFGWHLIVPEKVYPAMIGDPEAIRQVAVARLLEQKRRKRLAKLTKKWLAESQLETYPQVIADAEKKQN